MTADVDNSSAPRRSSPTHAPFFGRLRAALQSWFTRWEFQVFLAFVALMQLVAMTPPDQATWSAPPLASAAPETIPAASEINADTEEFVIDVTTQHLITYLPKLQQLRTLTVTLPQLPPDGMDILTRCNRLEWLTLNGVRLSDREFEQLGQLRTLTHLGLLSMDLTASEAGDAILRKIPFGQDLTSLSLAGCRVGNDDLIALAGLPRLERLDLSDSTVDGGSSTALLQLSGLNQLNLVGSRFTRRMRAKLIQQLPHVRFQPEERFESAIAEQERQRAAGATNLMMALAFPAFLLGFGYGVQLKIQFAGPRRTLLPGFTAPHLAVAGTLLLLVTVPTAAAIWWSHRFHPIGILSLSWLLVSMLAWQTWRMNNALTIPMLAVWFGMLFGLDTDLIGGFLGRWFLTSEATPVAVFLLVADFVALTLLAVRVAGVHEEMPEYGMSLPSSGLRMFTSRSTSRDFDRLQGQRIDRSPWTGWLLDHYFAAMMKWMPASRSMRRIHQYQMTHGLGTLAALPVMCLIFFVVLALMPARSGPFTMGGVFPALFLPHFMVAFVGAIWLQHWRWFGTELLRPTSRLEFVHGVFRSVFLDVAYGVFWIVLIQCVACLRGVTIGEFTPLTSLLLAITLSVSYISLATATLLFVLTNGTWLSLVRTLTLIFMAFAPLGFGVSFVPQHLLIPAVTALLIGAMTAAGFLIRRARTRWMRLELA